MRKFTLATLVLCLVTAVGFAQMSDTEKAVISKEKSMYESIKKGDMDTFKANLAENFLSVYSSGFATKGQEVEAISNLTINSYELSDVKVMQPAENVAIIVYKVWSEGSFGEEEFSGSFYASSTWVKQDGTWKALMHTEVEAEKMEEEESEGY